MEVASLILAAGKGTRMVGYGSCKALLPLIPSKHSIYEGNRPFILEILDQLPQGPKAIVIHHDGENVKRVVKQHIVPEKQPIFIWQPELNGTGGAVLAAKDFLNEVSSTLCLITMADVPLIRNRTYEKLVNEVNRADIAGSLLAFRTQDKAQYGCLVVIEKRVKDIVEWKYWKDFDPEKQKDLELCNAGVYAFKRDILLQILPDLAKKPHLVHKTINGQTITLKELFLTDIVALMVQKNLTVTFIEADESEVLGIDTPEQLKIAQEIYQGLKG